MVLAIIDWARVVKEAGLLAYPLLGCSVVAVFIIFERAFALRNSEVMPDDLTDAVLQGKMIAGGNHSALGRVIDFVERHPGDAEGAKAYARLEIMKMERGVSYLDTIYVGAPLLGLIGTVSGLLTAFNVIDPDTRMPDPVRFTESVGYALSATLLGLCVAVLALVGNGFLQRLVDKHAAKLDVLLERVISRHGKVSAAPASVESR
ncbi:MotA/TolQ/ExbB proton channel family protein [Horticoccus luteus]|uniref:MotA/TolQ/ExbB proton channel family protein n=1 Tax=Horticoccus luteus TaxID=2862869 RepID=A0A8F9TZ48_9BACT|nr:MotA/TolQ/ExbB proton channel family protein [Horticoccus luteus]QYM80418.1 MotA/TolQ/ExbB proton channel family protein [Horticoccus luteus]